MPHIFLCIGFCMQNILFLGSKSPSRQLLLTQAGISFITVDQDSNETICDVSVPFKEIVMRIAQEKMEHVILPQPKSNDCQYFVLTADTLTYYADNSMSGKPVDRNDAIKKIKKAAEGSTTGTAFCLDKKIWVHDTWQTENRILGYAQGFCRFILPDQWLNAYLKQVSVCTAGAIFVEGFGMQFVKDVQGSYSAIIGLPMFELREGLQEIGFF